MLDEEAGEDGHGTGADDVGEGGSREVYDVSHAGREDDLREEVGTVEGRQVRSHSSHRSFSCGRRFVTHVSVIEVDLKNRKRYCNNRTFSTAPQVT